MWDGIEPAAFDGLRYLKALRGQPVRLSAEMFQAFMNQPRPERKSLTEALKATKGPSGSDIYDWMLAIGWIQLEDDDRVSVTDLGLAVLGAAGSSRVETEAVETIPERMEPRRPPDVTLTVEDGADSSETVEEFELGEPEPFIVG